MAFPPPNYAAAPYNTAVGFLGVDPSATPLPSTPIPPTPIPPQPARMLVYFQHTSGAVFSLYVTASETVLDVKRRLQV